MAIQRTVIDGQNDIVIQIEGDNIAVNPRGLAHLTLTRYLTRRRVDTDIDFLSPYSRSIPLIGRDAELSGLRTWLTSETPIVIRVLTGRAGSGKTRLALELCAHMVSEGWDAGFVEGGELERFRAQQNLDTWGWQRPTLIVSDDAAIHAERLHDWCQELADCQAAPGKPLRLLLLERNAEVGSGWWQTAFGRVGVGTRNVRHLLAPAEPVPLPPIAASGHQRQVIGLTMERSGSDQRPPQEGIDADFDRQLAALTWGGEPLFLMMAGLAATRTGEAATLSLGRTDLAFRLAERELARIAELGKANGVDPGLMVRMAAYVTLCQGLDAAGILTAIAAERAALDLPAAGDHDLGARVLSEAFPRNGGAAPMTPDMIGEAAILLALPEDSAAGRSTVLRAFGQAGQRVAATVIRTAQDFAADGCRAPLDWLDGLVEHRSVEADQLVLISDALPKTSLALQRHAAEITAALVDLLRQEISRDGRAERRPMLANALTNLGFRLDAIGESKAALPPAQEAVDIHRELAKHAPEAHRPDLAFALVNLATSLRTVGLGQEAVAPAQEAVEIFGTLAERAPDTYRSGLAGALNNLATCLAAVGRHEEALAPTRGAITLRRKLAIGGSDTDGMGIASALSSLSNRLSALGRRQEALAPAQESAKLFRDLAARAPDAYRPGFARALTNLAASLVDLGQVEEALQPAQEAAEIYRSLAAAAPDAHRPGLSIALMNLSQHLSAVGQPGEALGPAREAADLLRALTEIAPAVHRPDLALALDNLANCLSDAGHHDEALVAAREAITIGRMLAEQEPDAYLRMLATALGNLANRLSETDRPLDALAPAQEAVALHRALAEEAPDAHEPGLAIALMTLAGCLYRADRNQDALSPAQESVDLYRALARAVPDAFRPRLATALSNLTSFLGAVGRRQDSLDPAREATQIFRELAQRAPDIYRADLAYALNNLSHGLDETGRPREAFPLAEEAVRLLAPMFLAMPIAFDASMSTLVSNYLDRCRCTGEEIDRELLDPILEMMSRLREGSNDGGG